jgi:hypothetical protein
MQKLLLIKKMKMAVAVMTNGELLTLRTVKLGVELLTETCTIEGGGVWTSRTPQGSPHLVFLAGFGPSTWRLLLASIHCPF